MNEDLSGALARWTHGILIVAIIMSALWAYSFFMIKTVLPGQELSVWPSILTVALIWLAALSAYLGLRATSSILAAIVSMLYAFVGGFVVFTPGPYRFGGLIPIAFAVYLYSFCTKTWEIHEVFWLGQKRKAESQ